MKNTVLQVRNLCKRYAADALAVNSVSFSVGPGEIFALLGPSGCGKTTILRIIAGFDTLDHGEVWLMGRCVSNTKTLLPPEKRTVGFVFQDLALFPHLSVLENVLFGLHRLASAQRKKRGLEVLEMVGLSALKDRYPSELSGGQQQRVALARAIAPRPPIILFDEPFSSLDADMKQATRVEVRALLKENGISAVLVTHDQEEALSFADRIGVMHAGKIEQIGTPESVYHRPATAFVARFLGRANLIEGMAEGHVAHTPLGQIRLTEAAHGPVLLSLRPEHLGFCPPTRADCVHGKVLERAFKGHDITYRVEVKSESYLVHTDYSCLYHPGDEVCVVVKEPAVVVDKRSDKVADGAERFIPAPIEAEYAVSL